jgi:hypothetical protein
MVYSYKEEKDYIEKYGFKSYLDLSPPPCNMPDSKYKLWRLHNVNTFLHWYGKNCDYLVTQVPATQPFVMPPFIQDCVNFVQVGPYVYLVTYYNQVM